MISIISGRLGCGKSYLAVEMMLSHLRKGGVVATNIRLVDIGRAQSRVIQIDGDCHPTDLPSGDRRGHGDRRVMIVIDEALSWFGVSETRVDPRKQIWADWLRHSDKLGQDIFLICQEWTQTVKWIRILSQRVWFCHNSRNERILRWLPFKFLYAAEKNTVDVEREKSTEPARAVRTRFFRCTSNVYRHYDTAETYGGEQFESKNVYEGIVIWKKNSEFGLLPYYFILAFLGFASTCWLQWVHVSPIKEYVEPIPIFSRLNPDILLKDKLHGKRLRELREKAGKIQEKK